MKNVRVHVVILMKIVAKVLGDAMKFVAIVLGYVMKHVTAYVA
jgi:hypothetical protein